MELWDVYDINRKFTGKVIDRHSDEKLKEGEYHLVVQSTIINDDGKLLLGKRAEFKKIFHLCGNVLVAQQLREKHQYKQF